MDRDLIFFIIGIAVTLILTFLGILVTFFLSDIFISTIGKIWFRWKKQISWHSFYSKLSNPKLRAAIEVEGKKPDIIIGVNSGIVPASILAFNYQIKELFYLLNMPTYSQNGNRLRGNINLPTIDISDKYILIVDDQYYSGETMKIVRESVEQLPGAGQAQIRTFAVFGYETPARRIGLDIQPLGKVSGILAKAPWVFSQEVEQHYLERNNNDG